MPRRFVTVTGTDSDTLEAAIMTEFANKKQPCRIRGFSVAVDGQTLTYYALLEYIE